MTPSFHDDEGRQENTPGAATTVLVPGSGGPMRLPRFPRLERLLGRRLDDLDEAAVRAMVGIVAETDDLEFKGTLYGGTDKDRLELGKDLAALANHQGGVVMLGVEADPATNLVTCVPGVELAEAEEQRMRQIAAERVSPTLDWHLAAIRSGASQTRGWYLLVVPRSSLRPHLLRTSSGQAHTWRAPCRDGTTTRFMAESEIADRYRNRFGLAGDQTSHLRAITQAASSQVSSPDFAYLTVSVVPTRPGDLRLTRSTPNEVSQALRGRGWPFEQGRGIGHEGSIGIGRSELTHRLNTGEHPSEAAHFYTDGSCSITSAVGQPATWSPASGRYAVNDEILFGEIVNSLTAAAIYATELTGTGGDALIQLHLHLPTADGTCQLQRRGALGRNGFWTQRVVGKSATTDTMIVLEDLTGTEWSPRLQAVWFASQRLYQAFGLPACPHVAEGGQVRWGQFTEASDVKRRAADYEIELTDDLP